MCCSPVAIAIADTAPYFRLVFWLLLPWDLHLSLSSPYLLFSFQLTTITPPLPVHLICWVASLWHYYFAKINRFIYSSAGFHIVWQVIDFSTKKHVFAFSVSLLNLNCYTWLSYPDRGAVCAHSETWFFCTVRQQKLFICGFYWICIYPNTVHLFHLKHLKGPPCYSAIQQNAHYVFATMWEALWEVCSKAAWCNLDKCGRNEDQIEIVVAGKVGRSHRKSLTALSVCINWPTEGFLFVRHERNLSCCSWQYCCLSLLSPLLSTIFSVIIQEEMCWLHRKTPLSPLLAWDNPVGSPSQSNNWITRIFWVVKTWV